MEKKDITAVSGKAKDPVFDALRDDASSDIVRIVKSKDLTVQQALWVLDRARSLLMDSRII